MKATKVLFASALWLCAPAALLASDARPPSTPADREQAVRFAHALEEDPLGAQAAEQRGWVLGFLDAAPDVHVNVCLELIGPLLKSDKPSIDALTLQLAISTGAFVIEHPETARDDAATSLAGLLGVLKAYEHVIQVSPTSRLKFLEDLLRKRDNGDLPSFVAKGLAKCAKYK